MKLLLEKLYNIPIALLMIVGLALSAFLFYSLMKAAENGNLLMVIVLAIAISIVSILVSKVIKSHYQKQLCK
jgi:uncharacterized membrane protein